MRVAAVAAAAAAATAAVEAAESGLEVVDVEAVVVVVAAGPHAVAPAAAVGTLVEIEYNFAYSMTEYLVPQESSVETYCCP